jgi:hypothetical protein
MPITRYINHLTANLVASRYSPLSLSATYFTLCETIGEENASIVMQGIKNKLIGMTPEYAAGFMSDLDRYIGLVPAT